MHKPEREGECVETKGPCNPHSPREAAPQSHTQHCLALHWESWKGTNSGTNLQDLIPALCLPPV